MGTEPPRILASSLASKRCPWVILSLPSLFAASAFSTASLKSPKPPQPLAGSEKAADDDAAAEAAAASLDDPSAAPRGFRSPFDGWKCPSLASTLLYPGLCEVTLARCWFICRLGGSIGAVRPRA